MLALVLVVALGQAQIVDPSLTLMADPNVIHCSAPCRLVREPGRIILATETQDLDHHRPREEAAALGHAPEATPPEQEVAAGRFLDVRHLQAGTPVPADGVWMDLESALIVARSARACEEEREVLRKAPPAWLPWVVGAVALAAGGVGGYQLHRLGLLGRR
jgi:hypothetical protein